jgi:hypothetical protein
MARRVGFRIFNIQRDISVSDDDVPESAFSVGAAALDAHGVKGAFYIAGALCNTVGPDGRSLITSPECLELHRRGHEIGSAPWISVC